MQPIANPFEPIHAKLEELAAEIRALRKALKKQPERDEIGQIELAMSVTGLARRTIHKLTHRRTIPHRRVEGRLYFRRSELEAWIDLGRRPTATEVAHEVMSGRTTSTTSRRE